MQHLVGETRDLLRFVRARAESESSAHFLDELQANFNQSMVRTLFKRMSKLRVLIVGETILDEYVFCDPMGKSGKDPVLAVKQRGSELQLGGALAIANHVAALAGEVRVLSALGERGEQEDFVRAHLAPKIDAKFLRKRGSPTIVKRRFLDQYSLSKFFGVYELNDEPLVSADEERFIGMLDHELQVADVVIVADYGHGLLTPKAVTRLAAASPYLCVNTQINASNFGYHVISRYPRANFVCLHEGELRLDARDKLSPPAALADRLAARLQADAVMVTLGKRGTLLQRPGAAALECPALADRVVERVGAGDAVLSVASLAMCCGADQRLVSLLGNLAGAQAVEHIGNHQSISRKRLLADASLLVLG